MRRDGETFRYEARVGGGRGLRDCRSTDRRETSRGKGAPSRNIIYRRSRASERARAQEEEEARSRVAAPRRGGVRSGKQEENREPEPSARRLLLLANRGRGEGRRRRRRRREPLKPRALGRTAARLIGFWPGGRSPHLRVPALPTPSPPLPSIPRPARQISFSLPVLSFPFYSNYRRRRRGHCIRWDGARVNTHTPYKYKLRNNAARVFYRPQVLRYNFFKHFFLF